MRGLPLGVRRVLGEAASFRLSLPDFIRSPWALPKHELFLVVLLAFLMVGLVGVPDGLLGVLDGWCCWRS